MKKNNKKNNQPKPAVLGFDLPNKNIIDSKSTSSITQLKL